MPLTAFVSCATGKLPEGATKLVALEELYLNDTFLEFLPANFGRLTKLRLLELRENQLATLPKSMARLTALTRLDLGQNDVTDLPEVVPSIPSLTELWLDGNRLDVLPDSIGSLQVRPHPHLLVNGRSTSFGLSVRLHLFSICLRIWFIWMHPATCCAASPHRSACASKSRQFNLGTRTETGSVRHQY
jgi:hypothetical protein